ncbi:HSPB1-associated protein 1 [Plutella xylostella]|uniref:HSPB1-associated protein 1 n=1 Tax=Plutella xylostella TaxID=51655 RepID=UPI002032D459|nr:HSPB1-associated protein 1 [Plutella xylostella]
MNVINEELLHSIISQTNMPLVLRGFVNNWSICQWDMKKWASVFGQRDIPFRTMKKDYISDEPCWERKCQVKTMKFEDYLNIVDSSEDWMYFDYKYLHQWFNADEELCKEISWKQFGYPDKGAADTTLWIGSDGAHTPTHQDTYGVNIVAQVYGKKRWLLFPPEAGGMKSTRVPYEESSIYSELNFYCPNSLEDFRGLSGGRVVELCAGDALVLPRGWWHYVQNLAPTSVAVNCWLPHEKDISTRVSEALIKILVAQICKDLPQSTRALLINPNEDDISDTPLAVLFLQLETVAKLYLDNRRKTRRAKRQRTCEPDPAPATTEEYDLKALLENTANKMELAQPITSEGIIGLIQENLKRYANVERVLGDDEVDGSTASLCLTKALIDAYSDENVVEQVKRNLLAKLS